MTTALPTLGPSLLARARKSAPRQSLSQWCCRRGGSSKPGTLNSPPRSAVDAGLPNKLVAPEDPEAIRDAKGWLTRQRTDGLRYKPTADQAALGSAFDIEQARKAPSFDKFRRDVEKLLGVGGGML